MSLTAWLRDWLRLDAGEVIEDHALLQRIASAEADRDVQFKHMQDARQDIVRHSAEFDRLDRDLDKADALFRKAIGDGQRGSD